MGITNQQPGVAEANEEYIIIDKVQQQTLQDAEDVSKDLKPLADLLKNSPDLLKALLDPTDYDLYKAIYEGRTKLAAELINRGRNVNFSNVHDLNTTCLHLAARSPDSQLIKTVLAGKPDLDPVNAHGVTPLMIAAIYGNTDNAKALLEAGADKEFALESSRLSPDALLDIDETVTTGSTALILAAQHGHTETVKALLAHGANVNVKTNHGFTALHACAMNGSADCVSALLDSSCPTTIPDLIEAETDGQFTPLIYAANTGHQDVARVLLDHGANLEHKKSLDMTALLEACWTEETGMVELLISRGANIEAVTDDFNDDIEHFTPLMLAAKFDLVEIAELLLAAGADKKAVSGAEETAAEIAENNGNVAVLELLKKA